MKIKHNHPILTDGIRHGDTIMRNGMTYKVIDEDFGYVEVEPDRLMAWKRRSKF